MSNTSHDNARQDAPEQTGVAQPSPAVCGATPAKSDYRRDLPHMQRRDKTIFVTFNTHRRWVLPESVRQAVLERVLAAHGFRIELHAAVVMPDHVHLLFTPVRDNDGNTYGLAQIMNSIKGASAHAVNKALQRRGRVWQSESFDHILRSDEDVRATAEYIGGNPTRAGLPEPYPWIWRAWIAAAAPRTISA